MKLSPIKPVCIAPPWTGGSPCPGHPRPIPIPLPLPGPDLPIPINPDSSVGASWN
jgi:hypothetical protein